MSKKPLVWSPYERETYTVTLADGSKAGIGALDLFDDRPGLWNIVWLHSERVDHLLDWQEDPLHAPAFSLSVYECEKSADFLYGALTLESWAEELFPEKWIKMIAENDLHPPIREFWDECEHPLNSWLLIATRRARLSRYHTERTGNKIVVNF